ILNMAVSLLGTVMFFRAGCLRQKLFLPMVALSVPMAYIGGGIQLPPGQFHALLGAGLALAALRLLFPPKQSVAVREPDIPALLVVGALLGLVSGLIGVGGGIFLTPLLIIFRWADARTAAGVSAPFIFINSAAGLAGLGPAGIAQVPSSWPMFLLCVLAGGWAGAAWGSGHAPDLRLRQALGAVLAVAVAKLFLVAMGNA
ncbi:MAG: sulfite exporter TauE/SafE family protein, partial [Terrimicrobiaceae bacterium]|nr:sulfite exporter TauE/SafE family protein [Terrimicrobiaceae bacterium]